MSKATCSELLLGEKVIKVRITYNTGYVLETNMNVYTFNYYTQERQVLYNPKYPTINSNLGDIEFVSLYGAVKLEKVGDVDNDIK